MCSLFRDITGGQETGTALSCPGAGGRRRADWPVRSAAAGLPADRKSIAYTFLYRDPAKTLTAAEVDAAHQRVLKALTDKVKGLSFR